MKHIICVACVSAVFVLGSCLANGAVTIAAAESQNGVLLRGAGTLNLSSLSTFASGYYSSAISTGLFDVTVGPPGNFFSDPSVELYHGESFQIPEELGDLPSRPFEPPRGWTPSDSGSGDLFGVGVLYYQEGNYLGPVHANLVVPEFHVSETELSGEAFF